MAASVLIRFYRHAWDDHRGRSLSDIRAFDTARLEGTHDFIQWLFPLPEPSGASAHAPILSRDDIATFAADPALREELRKSLDTMLAFYGLARTGSEGTAAVARGPNYAERSREWLDRSHNFLRISRILRCLALLGCKPEARALLACLEEIVRENGWAVGSDTLGYWRRAAAS
jgi:hypothetical protein